MNFACSDHFPDVRKMVDHSIEGNDDSMAKKATRKKTAKKKAVETLTHDDLDRLQKQAVREIAVEVGE